MDEHILITGGTGSLGKAITKYLIMGVAPSPKITIYSRGEVKQAEMKREMLELAKERQIDICYVIGDVRSYDRLLQVMKKNVTTVIHAAALKRVDTIEENPSEAIDTNVDGARNVIKACIECNIKACVALSTDKACNPINLYGATKLCSDKLFVSANQYSLPTTRFMVVRYGNVFTSRGSVVPFFVERAKHGLSIPVTDKRMTRFSLSLQHAVDLIFLAFSVGKGGEIFVAKTPSYRLLDLARAMSVVTPNGAVTIDFVGIRPGEKLHEIMVPADETHLTYMKVQYFCIYPAHSWYKNRPVSNLPAGFSYCSDTNNVFLTQTQLEMQIKEYIE